MMQDITDKAEFSNRTVEERQLLNNTYKKIGLVPDLSTGTIHVLSEKQGWNDGSPEKIALHSFFAGIEGELSGNRFMSGALVGGVSEAVVSKFMKTLGPNNPDLVQMASAMLGYATNKLAGEDALAGVALEQWGTKWNGSVDNYPCRNIFKSRNIQ